MDRRSLLGGGLALGATGLLAACSGGAAEAPSGDTEPDAVEGKVVHWTYPMGATQEEAWWTPIVEEFNQQYPKVEVQVVQQPWSGREQALTTAIAGKTAPDVVYFNPDFVPRYADQDLLLDLGKAMESERDAFVPSSLEAYTYNDTLYAFPLLMTVSNPGYNVEVLEKIGLSAPPRTFDEIRAAAEACVSNDFTFAQYTAADGSLNHTFYPFLWTAGGTPLSDDETMSAFAGPEGLKALQLLRDVADLQAWDPESLTQPIGKFEQTKFARGTELMGLTLGIPRRPRSWARASPRVPTRSSTPKRSSSVRSAACRSSTPPSRPRRRWLG
ncbi:ABC transporter substrate-binding protein [Parenemella sanctibonifatiensis]|nr:extracellular solute-binding protein [Parenemella sanctibonifatiensis]